MRPGLRDDADLVAQAQLDRQAFAPLYARYADPVYRYCYRRLGHPEVAADATSQTFARALAAFSLSDRIVPRLALHHRRQRCVRRSPAGAADDLPGG